MKAISYIPEGYKSGFTNLNNIDNEVFNSIKIALSEVSFAPSIGKLIKKISKNKGIDSEEFEDIFLSIGSLNIFLDRGVSKEDLVQDLIEISKEEALVQFNNNQQEEEYYQRLSFLVGNEQIYYAYKATDLSTESGNVFMQSKVLTDIRPIFGISFDESPKAGIVTHTLHIHYNSCESSGHKDIYLSLDSNDIATLLFDLERAQQKEDNLRSMFKKTGMVNLND